MDLHPSVRHSSGAAGTGHRPCTLLPILHAASWPAQLLLKREKKQPLNVRDSSTVGTSIPPLPYAAYHTLQCRRAGSVCGSANGRAEPKVDGPRIWLKCGALTAPSGQDSPADQGSGSCRGTSSWRVD